LENELKVDPERDRMTNSWIIVHTFITLKVQAVQEEENVYLKGSLKLNCMYNFWLANHMVTNLLPAEGINLIGWSKENFGVQAQQILAPENT
jgi:hypothetical protein